MGVAPTWREPLLVKGHLFWLEGRPQEQGRTTLLMRPAGNRHALPRELTPPPWNDKVDVPVQRKIVLERLAMMDEGASVG